MIAYDFPAADRARRARMHPQRPRRPHYPRIGAVAIALFLLWVAVHALPVALEIVTSIAAFQPLGR